MMVFVELIIITAVLIFIGYPLFSKKAYYSPDSYIVEDAYKMLLAKKDITFIALKDIEFDFNTGKLSLEDYNELKSQYEFEAINILQAIDKEKKRIKETKVKKDTASKVISSSVNHCTNCGCKIKSTDNFCGKCGNSIKV